MSIQVVSQFAAVRGASDPFEISCRPARLVAELYPAPVGPSPEAIGLPWHRPAPLPSVEVSVTSNLDRLAVVRLRVECTDGSFNQDWVRWTFAHRRARDLAGGGAVDAYDMQLDDERQVQVLVYGGEVRTVRLNWRAKLDGETPICTFNCTLILEEVANDGSVTLLAELPIQAEHRHPSADLLDMLPSMYREALIDLAAEDEDPGPPFFERYLRGFEDCMDPLRQTLDLMDRLFNPRTCPSSFVVWLAAWVCLPLNPAWSELKRRRLVREAVELFRWRGTARGLQRYLYLYTGAEARIEDQPVVGWTLGKHALLGTEQTILGDVPPHVFVVTVSLPADSDVNDRILQDIVTWCKPAHTAFTLNVIRSHS